MAEKRSILRLPLVPVFLAYGVGIYIGHFDLPVSTLSLILSCLFLLTVWALTILFKKEQGGTVFALFLFFLLGIFSIHLYLRPPSSSSSLSPFIGFDGVVLEGNLDRPPLESDRGTQLYLRVRKAILPDRRYPVQDLVLIFSQQRGFSLHRGDPLRLRCNLRQPHGFHNPGGFSYEQYLGLQRVRVVGFLSPEGALIKMGEGPSYSAFRAVERLRTHIRNFIEREAHPPSSGIIKALVLGERGDVSEEITEQFTTTGIAHLLAISGDHLGIVAFLSFSLFLWLFKRSEFLLLSFSVKKWAAVLTIPLILLYTFIAGAGISVIRATIMVITFFCSIVFSRDRDLLHTLALAAFLILLFSPPSLFDVSFQLSFLAVLSILYLVPRLLRWWEEGERILPCQELSWRVRLMVYLRISLLVTVVAMVGTAPFVALHFNRISVIGFFTNLLFVPWVGFIIVPLSLLGSLLSFFHHPLAALVIQIDSLLTLILLKTVAIAAALPYASFYVSTPTTLEIILFYLLLFFAIHLWQGRKVQYLFLTCCVVFLLNFGFWSSRGWFQKDLRLTFIDVGHGDSILVEFPKGKRMLVDGGGLHEDHFDVGKGVIAPFLWKKKIKKIDILVLTHPDPDHFKGLNFIASHFSIGQFWDNGLRASSASFAQLETILSKRKVQRSSLNQQTPSQMINGVQLSILNPPLSKVPSGMSENPSFLNNHSLVMRIQFGQVVFLLTGDIEAEAETRMVKRGLPITAHLLKIPHHGSASSSSQLFIERVSPSYAVLSVSSRNLGRLPHPEVLRRYERLGTRIFRTDQHGAITVVTDGRTIQIETFLKEKDLK